MGAGVIPQQEDPRVARARQLWDQLSQDENYGNLDDNQLRQFVIDSVKAEFANQAPATPSRPGYHGGPESLRQVQPNSPDQAARIQRILRNQAQAEIDSAAPESYARSAGRGFMRGLSNIGAGIENTLGFKDSAQQTRDYWAPPENENLKTGVAGELGGEIAGYAPIQTGMTAAAGKLLPMIPGLGRAGAAILSRIPETSPALRAIAAAAPSEVAGALGSQGLVNGDVGLNEGTGINVGLALLGAGGAGLRARREFFSPKTLDEPNAFSQMSRPNNIEALGPDVNTPAYLRRGDPMRVLNDQPVGTSLNAAVPDNIAEIVAQRQALAALEGAGPKPLGQGAPPMNVRPDLRSLFFKDMGTRMAESAAPNAMVGDMPPVPGGANLLYGTEAATDNSLRNMAHNMRNAGQSPQTPVAPGAPVSPTPSMAGAFEQPIRTTTGGAKTPPSAAKPRVVKTTPKAAAAEAAAAEAAPVTAETAAAEGTPLPGFGRAKGATSASEAGASTVSPTADPRSPATFAALEKLTGRKVSKVVQGPDGPVFLDTMGKSFTPEEVAAASAAGGAAPKARPFRTKPKRRS